MPLETSHNGNTSFATASKYVTSLHGQQPGSCTAIAHLRVVFCCSAHNVQELEACKAALQQERVNHSKELHVARQVRTHNDAVSLTNVVKIDAVNRKLACPSPMQRYPHRHCTPKPDVATCANVAVG
jgi:hypothetical protein